MADSDTDTQQRVTSQSTRLPMAEPRLRRRLIALTALRVAVNICSLLAIYFLLPLNGFGYGATLAYFVAGLIVFVCALIWQIRSILVARYPGLRAIEAIGFALPLFVILFASVYTSMDNAYPGSFSETLTRTASLYFTITVLSTVGFGDITARSDAARMMVSLQMLLDLVILGIIAKVIVGAARTGLERQRDVQHTAPPTDTTS